jgi:hypothetical protein
MESKLHGIITDGDLATVTKQNGKGKAIPITGHEGPQRFKRSRFPHFLDNRLTDGGEVVSIMHWPPFTPRKIPGTHFR